MSQIERITYIDRSLRERGSIKSSEAARRFEVSNRQIVRDIEYLRDRLDAPIEYDHPTRAYRYTASFDSLRFADEKLLIFYALAKRMAANEHYVPVVSAELLSDIESHIARDYRQVSDRISYELPVAEKLSMEDFTIACQAMLLERRLDLSYTDAKGGRSERSVEPERLINYSGRWYLVAYDLLRSDLRTFHMSRIERIALSKHRVASPRPEAAGKDRVDRFIAAGFGIFKGGDTVPATIRVHGSAAALVARQSWHPEQKVARGTDERGSPYTDLSIPVADWTELLGRVLSFGSAAEPLAPPELRERWKAEIARLSALAEADHYTDDGDIRRRGGGL